jgi:hypothetical protein
MSIEELLKPRYKVIALWPGATMINVGDIFMPGMVNAKLCWRRVGEQYGHLSVTPTIHGPEFYPHLFRSLEWWEERNDVELPGYIRFGEIGAAHCYYKIKRYDEELKMWIVSSPTRNGDDYEREVYLNRSFPATEEEYTNHFKLKYV